MSGKKAKAAVSETEQPFLFDAKLLPMRPDLVAMVKEKRFLHTGKLLGDDEELCRSVCRDLQLGLSGRKVAKKYRISRNSVWGIEQVMRERGELEPLKKATIAQLDAIIFMGLERIQEGIAEDEISPGQLPIPIAALIDKKGQLEAGVVPGTGLTVAEVTADQVAEAFRAMKRVTVSAVSESQSVVTVPERQQIEAGSAQDTALDTAGAGSRPAPTPLAAAPGSSPEEARQGGGGSAPSPGLETVEGNGQQNFGPKEAL